MHLLSTMHNAPSTDNTEKKKPLVIHFYNKNKVGVDGFDQMARQYTTHSASRRWPLAVWTKVLDIASLNAWIIFRKTTGSKVSRRDFILDLIEGLKQNYVAQRKNTFFRVDIPLEQRRSSRPPNPPIGGGPGQLWGPKLV